MSINPPDAPERPSERSRTARSGKHTAAPSEWLHEVNARLDKVREDLGAEMKRRDPATCLPCAWQAVAAAMGVGKARLSQARAGRNIKPATLTRWEMEAYGWITGEKPTPDPEEVL